MKKIILAALTASLVFMTTQEAKAWRFWGKELGDRIAVNEIVCGIGRTGYIQKFTKYVFGIPVEHDSELVCL